MVLAFDQAGDFAKAVYGGEQHTGANGAIAMNNVASMQGGRSQRNKRGGKSRRQRRQRGGK